MDSKQHDGSALWCRYEFKYLIAETQALAIMEYIRPHMRPDPHSVNGAYPLVSLYLDSNDLRLCRESVEGVKNRYKLRIRAYGDGINEPRFLEIKRRINRIIVKSRAQVRDHEVAELLAGHWRPPRDGTDTSATVERFLYYKWRIGANPILRVRYLRNACVGKIDNSVRVTFDRDLLFNLTYSPIVRLTDNGWQAWPQHGVVLEIKFTGHCPRWLVEVIQRFGLQSRSLSKYASGARLLSELRVARRRAS